MASSDFWSTTTATIPRSARSGRAKARTRTSRARRSHVSITGTYAAAAARTPATKPRATPQRARRQSRPARGQASWRSPGSAGRGAGADAPNVGPVIVRQEPRRGRGRPLARQRLEPRDPLAEQRVRGQVPGQGRPGPLLLGRELLEEADHAAGIDARGEEHPHPVAIRLL